MTVCILALVIRHANRIFSAPYYIVICGLSKWLYLIFPNLLIKTCLLYFTLL